MSCTILTINGRKCRKPALRDGKCSVHLTQECAICFEDVRSNNTQHSKRLTCAHSFHMPCIMQWFQTSNACPVCRVAQVDDPIIKFKDSVEENMRLVYQDAIQTLERQLAQQRRRYRQLIIED